MHDIEQFYNTQINEMPQNVADLIWFKKNLKFEKLEKKFYKEIK